jgi:autotransporter-associated beta strand protein
MNPRQCVMRKILFSFGLLLLASVGWAAPTAPTHLVVSAPAIGERVSLTWNASAGATSYSVKRASSVGGTFSTVGSPTGTSFTDATAVSGTRYFYRVTAIDGTGEGLPSATISTAPSIVVDNSAGTGVTLTGAWTVSTGLAGFYGANYLHDDNTGATGGKSVRFTPTLPFSGRYDVYMRWVSDSIRASNARVEIASNAGTTFTRVNQRIDGGTWVKLGAFNFTAGTAGSILIRNNGADGWVIADAVQLVLNEQPAPGYTQATFTDEFDGTAFDSGTWSVYDSRPNNIVSGGQLRLTTTANGADWDTGGLYTTDFMQRFGYYEAVFQVGRSDGLNNAFWLSTPASLGNDVDALEIDISEAHAHNDNHVTVHDWQPVYDNTGRTHAAPEIYPGYHTAGLEWATDGTLRWYWDGQLVHTVNASQLNSFQSMLPLQVMFSTKVIPFAGTPGPTMNGSSMNVDNVRVWMKPGWEGAVSGNWGTPDNWGPDGVPDSGDAAVFNRPTTRTAVSILGDKNVKELYFTTPDCPAMTLEAGSFKLLLGKLVSGTGVGGILMNGDVTTTQTINTAIQAQNDLTFANYSTAPTALLSINSILTSTATNRKLTLAGNGRVNLGSSLGSSFGSVVKINAGTALLSGANAFTGAVDIQNGKIVVTHGSALGSSTAGTTVASGATLALAGGVIISGAETVRIAGNGETGTSGALDVEDSSAVSFTAPLIMDSAARIGSGAGTGTLTLGTQLDTTAGGFTLNFAGSGATIMNGNIIGAGALVKNGTGTLQLNGIASHTGTTTVNQGTLSTNLVSLPGALVNFGTVIFDDAADRNVSANWGGTGTYVKEGAGTLTFSGTMSANGFLELRAGSVKLGASERFSNALDLIVNAGAVFDLNAFTETLGPVELFGGSIINSTGDSTQFLAGSSYLFRSGSVSARLGGPGSLTKTTVGTVTISGANTFTGGSTVQEGTLDLAGSLNSGMTLEGGLLTLGSSTGQRTIAGSLSVNAQASVRFRLNGTTVGTQFDQIRLTGGASVLSLSGSLELVAAPALTAGSTYRIIDNTGSSSAVSGTFAGLPQNAEFFEDGQWWRINYSGGTGNDVVLTRIAPTAWQTWLGTSFGTNSNNLLIAGPLADYDQDGAPNLLEYATATNPGSSTTVPQSTARSGTNLEYTYTKNKAATDVAYIVEWADALPGTWSTAGVNSAVVSDNGTTQQIRATMPAGPDGRRFIRLRVTQP